MYPASIIKFYIQKTAEYRNNENTLILTHKKLYHPASSETISRWLKNTMSLCGINVNIFSGHSIRRSATSTALKSGVNIETITRTAGWTSANTF